MGRKSADTRWVETDTEQVETLTGPSTAKEYVSQLSQAMSVDSPNPHRIVELIDYFHDCLRETLPMAQAQAIDARIPAARRRVAELEGNRSNLSFE